MMALQGRDITFRYHRGPLLLDQVNIEVRAGQCVGLMGPSGCGKTTLCHILAGIIPPRSIPARRWESARLRHRTQRIVPGRLSAENRYRLPRS